MTSLYVDRRHVELRVDGGALAFYDAGGRVGTVPLAPLERVFLQGDVQLSARVLGKLGARGIGVIVLAGREGRPALLMGCPHQDARRRMAQCQRAADASFCLAHARHVVRAKLRAQYRLLARLREERPVERHALGEGMAQLAHAGEQLRTAASLDSLRGLEGAGARAYFAALASVLPPSLGFQGRNRRPPRDPFNVVISLGYTLLAAESALMLHGVGLDPAIGFLHEPAWGRDSLACDVIEPLRPQIDAFALRLFAEQVLRVEDFSQSAAGCRLGKAGRVHFYTHYEALAETLRRDLAQEIRLLGQAVTCEALSAEAAPASDWLSPAPTETRASGDDHGTEQGAERGSDDDGLPDLL